jgi:ornithine cyclodeaminase/alanine dehydrogenase
MPAPPEILYLSRADVEALALPMPAIIDRVEAAFLEKGLGRTEMPPKPAVHPGGAGTGNFIHAMPALIPAMGAVGVKWISGFPANPQRGLPYICGLLILNDVQTGLPVAVMDATWITAMRTGAATAVAVRKLARRDAGSFAILGCGVQGRTNLEAVATVAPSLREVRAYDIDPGRTERYIEEMKARFPALRFVAARGPGAAVEGADIVVTAGPILARPEPSLEASWFGEGALAVPLDYDAYWKPEALRRAERFYTDDSAQLLYTRSLGAHFRDIPAIYADLGEVVAGRKEGRLHDRERLVCMNMGIALEDMATASLLLERAQAQGLGTRLPL